MQLDFTGPEVFLLRRLLDRAWSDLDSKRSQFDASLIQKQDLAELHLIEGIQQKLFGQ